jgi:DNA-directed RNA polymerase specialized sigma24 family protein
MAPAMTVRTSNDQAPARGSFPQTRWSVVISAQADDPAALAELCRTYWYPLYCCARRLTSRPDDAEDLTQGFFAALLGRQGLKTAAAARGKLRSFLLGGLKNYAAEQYRNETRKKRGGGCAVIAFDALEAEQRYSLEPRDEASPEREFDRAWARQLLASVLTKLGESYRAAGKGAVFDALSGQLTPGDAADYAAAEKSLGISAGAVRFAAFKLRERYREMLRAAIGETVTSPEEVEEELVHLRGLFGL